MSFATKKHEPQTRKFNGEPYVNHCIRVAKTVRKYHLDNVAMEDLVVVALLHDTLEDTDTTYEELAELFGAEVADMVRNLTNDENEIKLIGKPAHLAKKILLLTPSELLVKLADRLDNVANMAELDPSKIEWVKQYSKQTELVFFNTLDIKKLDSSCHETILSEIWRHIEPYV